MGSSWTRIFRGWGNRPPTQKPTEPTPKQTIDQPIFFPNLNLKIPNPEIQIQKLQNEEREIESIETGYVICGNQLIKITRRIKRRGGAVIESDVREIEKVKDFCEYIERIKENIKLENVDEKLNEKIKEIENRVPMSEVERELNRIENPEEAHEFVRLFIVDHSYIDEFLKDYSILEEYYKQIERIEKERKELEKEMEKEGINKKEVERKIYAKEKVIKEISEKIRKVEKKIEKRIEEIERKLKDREKIAKEIDNCIRKIEELKKKGKKDEEIIKEISKVPQVKKLIEGKADLDSILTKLKREREKVYDPFVESLISSIERIKKGIENVRKIKEEVEKIRKFLKVIEEMEKAILEKDEVRLRESIKSAKSILPNEFLEIIKRIEEKLDELLKKRNKISAKDYVNERDKFFVFVDNEFKKITVGKKIYEEVKKILDVAIKKRVGISAVVNFIEEKISWIIEEIKKYKKIKERNDAIKDMYEKERRILSICDELCAYIKSGKEADLRKLYTECNGIGIDVNKLFGMKTDEKVDIFKIRRLAKGIVDEFNKRIASLLSMKI